jgi:hypothetical protein
MKLLTMKLAKEKAAEARRKKLAAATAATAAAVTLPPPSASTSDNPTLTTAVSNDQLEFELFKDTVGLVQSVGVFYFFVQK